MHAAFCLLATLLALTLEIHGQTNEGANIKKNERKSFEHGTDYNHKSSGEVTKGEAKKSGGHHSKHKTFKLNKFHKHTKSTHKHGQHKGKEPLSKKGKIGKKKGKKKKVHKKKTHKRTRTRRHKKHTKKHGKCKGKKIYIKTDPFCQDKTHKNHCRFKILNCIHYHECTCHSLLFTGAHIAYHA